jgi:hypothetical protein
MKQLASIQTQAARLLFWPIILALSALPAQADSADTVVTFNEIMYHPATNEANLEWIELYNQMSYDMDISNWKLEGGVNYTFPEGTRIRGRGYVVIASNPSALNALPGLRGVLGPFSNRISNAGE